MLNSSNFNNDGFENSKVKTVEKVHYIGDLRIIGQIVEYEIQKDPIGYIIMTERNQKFKAYTVNQTKVLLSKFKFVNAELVNDNIVNTECSMLRLPKYFKNMQPAGNYGIIVIGEIVEGPKVIGYRALVEGGRIVDLSENELIETYNRGLNIINAKVVTKNNKMYISAIKGEFTKIEKSKVKNIKIRDDRAFEWRKQKHMEKWLNYGAPRALRWAFLRRGDVINSGMYSRYTVHRGEGSYFDFNKEAAILAKEVYIPKNGITLSDEDKKLYKDILKNMRHQELLVHSRKCTNKLNYDDRLFIIAISQFILNNKQKQEELLGLLSKNPSCYKDGLIRDFFDSGYACKSFKDVIVKLKKMEQSANADVGKLTAEQQKKMFKTREFVKAVDMAQLGFTISESNRGYKFETETGRNKTLLYLGDVITDNYELYRSKSRCLGDIATIAYVEKLRNNFYSYNMYEKDIIAAIELIITIAYMFSSQAMKLYVDNVESDLKKKGILLPSYDEIAGVDYRLPSEIKMYYSSGFNVFLNDGEYLRKNYMSNHLKYSELIDYRQLGIKHDIKHPMLKSELASTVSILTPDNCSSDMVEKMIGQLRFL